MTLNEQVQFLIRRGWEICYCSCACGGMYAWLKPRPSGAKEMVGCICHQDLEKLCKEVEEIQPKLSVIHINKAVPSASDFARMFGGKTVDAVSKTRADGGPILPGTPYLVGEHPCEEIA